MKKWRVQGFAALTVCLLLAEAATPAAAAFTGAEQTEMLRLVSGATTISEIMRYLSFAMQGGSQKPVGEALNAASEASREAHLAYGLLLNIVVQQRATSAFDELQAVPRDGRVALAWSHLDRSLRFLDSTESALTRALSATTDPTSQDSLQRARDIWVANARQDLRGVDRSLAFSSPNPPTYPAVIGPHGSYDDAEWFLWRANWYALDMLEAISTAYAEGPTLPDYWPVYKAVNSASILLDTVMRAQGVVAGMTFTPAQASLDPFFRVLDELRTITTESSERYMEIQENLAAWVPQLSSAAACGGSSAPSSAVISFVAALTRLTDSWRNVDHAVWQELVFLNCTAPTGCGGR
jgi:hypothetical protein